MLFGAVCFGTAAADEGADVSTLDGSGTEDDPYVITTVDEFQAIDQERDAQYVLEADIDASKTEDWNAGRGFDPIGDRQDPFSGSFDGQGHTITGLTIDRPGESLTAPFGFVGGTVENVEFEDVTVVGGDRYVGGVAGETTGEIRSVSVSGTVTGQDKTTGGLSGRATEGSNIVQSHADVDVSAAHMVGGLTGINTKNARIMHSSAAGDVDGDRTVGGLVGYNYADVRNAYATGDVTGADGVGGLSGRDRGSVTVSYVANDVSGGADETGAIAGVNDEASFDAVYYDRSRTSASAVGVGEDVGTGLETSELTGASAEANTDLDFSEDWALTDDYPVLQSAVREVDLEVSQPSIGEGETTGVSVTLTLADGSTVTATDVAEYDSEAAVAAVSGGTLEATSVGQTDVTATVAGQTDTVTVEVLEPPNVEFVDAAFETEAVVDGSLVEATATYENTGGPGSETATVAVDGETVATRNLEIGAGGETTATIAWEATDGGAVTLDGEPLGELSVVDPGTVTVESIHLPEAAAAGSEYDVAVDLANAADRPVTDTVELRIDGEHVTDAPVTVDPDGSTETIGASHDVQGTATHVVELHGEAETATMEILEPAVFELSDLEAPDGLTVGDQATIDATVTNVGGGEDEAELALLVDGETTDTRTVTLGVDESETVAFETTVDETGDVTLTVESPDDAVETTSSVDDASGIPGFGVASALVALAVIGAVAARRQ